MKEEVEGKVGPLGGRKSKEYTEKYEFINDGIIANEEIHREGKCAPKRIAKVSVAQLVLQDLPPSKIRDKLSDAFDRTIHECKEGNECDICKVFDPVQNKDKRKLKVVRRVLTWFKKGQEK